MCSIGSIDKLPRDAHSVACFADAAFEDVADSQFSPNLLHVQSSPLVRKAGVPGDHEQPTHPRQRSDDLLDHPIRKILLIAVATHVVKWQNCNRWLAG